MRKIRYITCPICSKEFQSLGYASHRASHFRNRQKQAEEENPYLLSGDELKRTEEFRKSGR